MIKFKCVYCGNEFILSVNQEKKFFRGKTNLFCSRRCISKWTMSQDDIKNKIINSSKQTCLKKYGVENPWQAEFVKDKLKQTKLERYGDENYNNNIQISKSWHDKDIIEKKDKIKRIKQTKLERYGDENYCNGMAISNSLKNKTKDEREQITLKVKRTKLKNHGDENYNNREKFKETWKTGEPLKKEHDTKKRNKSFNSSSDENIIFELLCNKFNEVKRQYSSDKYKYACDFYVPDLELYIEYQGMWTHGNEPYDCMNFKHKEILDLWTEKSKNSNFYKGAIEIWTMKDVEKRSVAKINHLNWIEFFNLNQFYEWYNNI